MGKILFAIIALIGCFLIVYVYAFTYLNYSDKPANSDAVILFVGPVYKDRLTAMRPIWIYPDLPHNKI